jgi:hypothetical protein
MVRYAVIDGNTVENTIDAPSGFEIEGKTLVHSETAERGDLYQDGNFAKPEPQEKEPSELEVRLVALEAKAGITEEDKENARQSLKG